MKEYLHKLPLLRERRKSEEEEEEEEEDGSGRRSTMEASEMSLEQIRWCSLTEKKRSFEEFLKVSDRPATTNTSELVSIQEGQVRPQLKCWMVREVPKVVLPVTKEPHNFSTS